MCELNYDEKNSIRFITDTWSLDQLDEHFDNELSDTEHIGSDIDECLDENQDELSIDVVKLEPPVSDFRDINCAL